MPQNTPQVSNALDLSDDTFWGQFSPYVSSDNEVNNSLFGKTLNVLLYIAPL